MGPGVVVLVPTHDQVRAGAWNTQKERKYQHHNCFVKVGFLVFTRCAPLL